MKKTILFLAAIFVAIFLRAQSILPMPEWKSGVGYLCGKIVSAEAKALKKMEVSGCARTVDEETDDEFETKINADGTFFVEIPMFATHQSVYAQIGPWYGLLTMTQGDTVRVTLDLNESREKDFKLDKNPKKLAPDFYSLRCSGPLADVNNGITTPEARAVIWNSINNAMVFRNFPIKKRCSSEECFKVFRDWREMNLATARSLEIPERAKQVLEIAINAEALSESRLSAKLVEKEQVGKKDYCLAVGKFWREIGGNSLLTAYSAELDNVSDALLLFSESEHFMQAFGATDGAIFEAMAFKKKAKKKNITFNVSDKPKTSGEEFLVEVCRQHKGKVILIDFWGTWCAPCLAAQKQFAKHHDRLATQGVIFLYITDEESPEDVWNARKQRIPGEHYRITKKQSAELFRKFHLDGWPSYLIINKKGRLVFSKTAYHEQDILEAIEKALGE